MQTEWLRVKNFGAVTDAEISIKKINIIIGPASSGKSTIAKLISIFKSGKLYAAYDPMDCFKKMLSDYNISYPITQDTLIRYNYDDLYCEIKGMEFSANFALLNLKTANNTVYIPTERIFFPTFSQSIFNFLSNDINLPKWLIEFGARFENARTVLKRFKIDFLNVHYVFSNGNDLVELENGQIIKLSQASSGMQSIIPLMVVVEHYTSNAEKEDNLIVIEEPELSVFPKTQEKLLEFIIACINRSDSKLIITTHSPYIINFLSIAIQAEYLRNRILKSQASKNFLSKLNEIVPEASLVSSDDVVVFQLDQTLGGIKKLKTEDGIPSDKNCLNETLVESNHIFDLLLELEQESGVCTIE